MKRHGGKGNIKSPQNTGKILPRACRRRKTPYQIQAILVGSKRAGPATMQMNRRLACNNEARERGCRGVRKNRNGFHRPFRRVGAKVFHIAHDRRDCVAIQILKHSPSQRLSASATAQSFRGGHIVAHVATAPACLAMILEQNEIQKADSWPNEIQQAAAAEARCGAVTAAVAVSSTLIAAAAAAVPVPVSSTLKSPRRCLPFALYSSCFTHYHGAKNNPLGPWASNFRWGRSAFTSPCMRLEDLNERHS